MILFLLAVKTTIVSAAGLSDGTNETNVCPQAVEEETEIDNYEGLTDAALENPVSDPAECGAVEITDNIEPASEPKVNDAAEPEDIEPTSEPKVSDAAEPEDDAAWTDGTDYESFPAEKRPDGETVEDGDSPDGGTFHEETNDEFSCVSLPELRDPSPFRFVIDPHQLIHQSHIAYYGETLVEPDAILLFQNETGDYWYLNPLNWDKRERQSGIAYG